MARRGSILGLTIKVAKAIDKAGKQATRDAERRQKALAREQAQIERNNEKRIRERERDQIRSQKILENEAKQALKYAIDEEKQQLKNSLINAQDEYLERCSERAVLRKQFINSVLR
ncbi:hypothetical protein [Shewanella morhuae]|uniref:hypothetical protein n=1 Tax=Shewanella morhuae TaxID=365591 RepID=UPI001BBEE8BA|nr:hypothetical protein [Shewanella morhuae]GIU15308.1 hypothetical protein TUM4641_35450 [Shewanella morhuae]